MRSLTYILEVVGVLSIEVGGHARLGRRLEEITVAHNDVSELSQVKVSFGGIFPKSRIAVVEFLRAVPFVLI